MIRLILLFFILLFSSPVTSVAAQESPEPLSSYTPKTVGMCDDPQIADATEPEPFCQPGYESIPDSFSYIVPCQNQTNEETTPCQIGASVYGDGFAYPGSVNNKVYKSQSGHMIQTSNDKHLLYRISGDDLYFIQDTTWANAAVCSNGKQAFQRINGNSGQIWAPRTLSCGQQYATPGTNAAFEYDPGNEHALRSLPSNIRACTNQFTGNVGGQKQVLFHGNAICGSHTGPMLVLRNTNGAGAGEVFMYCQGKGLCAWYQNIKFSNSEAQPKNWVGKDLCSGFSHDYGSCYTDCHSGGYSQPVSLSVQEQLTRLFGKAFFGMDLLELRPAEGDSKVPIEKQPHLSQVSRAMLVDDYELRKKEASNYDAPPAPGKKVLRANNNNVGISVRGTIRTDGEEIVSNSSNDNAETSGEEQVIGSIENLTNMTDCVECREQDDFDKILGSISSKNTTTVNTPDGINLSKRNNLLADNLLVECSPSQMTATGNVDSAPAGKNVFVNTDKANNIILTIGSGFLDLAGRVLGGLLGDPNAKILNIPNTLCTCTKISNDEDLKNNTRTATYAFFPHQVTKQLDQVTQHGAQANPYTKPIQQAEGGESIAITQSYSYTNFVNTSLNAQKCSVLSTNSIQYQKECKNSAEFEGWSAPRTAYSGVISGDLQTATAQASAGKIPQCVLLGVLRAEGGGKAQSGGECKTNRCSATGPFQITIGRDANGDTSCPSCPAAGGTCPNAWGNTPGSPCDLNVASEQAVTNLQVWAQYYKNTKLTTADPTTQQDVIIAAATGYNSGTNNSQRRYDMYGGCTYGEYVYKECNPTFVCGSK